MSLDLSKVQANKGALVFDGGTRLGYTAEEIRLIYSPDHEPVTPEEFGNAPADVLNLGGPVFVTARCLQWDAATREAFGSHLVDGSAVKIGVADIGRKLSELTGGTLTFTPDVLGHVGFTALKAIPRLRTETEINFGTRRVTEYFVSFECLPDDVDGTQINIEETS